MKLKRITKARLKQELVSPSRLFTRYFLDKFHYISSRSFLKIINRDRKPVLIWDIRSNPITFDFIWLVIDAFNYFKEFKKYKYDLIIFIPDGYKPKPFSWNSYDKFFTSDDLLNRIRNMIEPLAKSFNCIDQIIFETDKKNIQSRIKNLLIYPSIYNSFLYYPSALRYSSAISSIHVSETEDIPYLSIKDANKFPSPSFNSYVTLTLRDHGYSPTRNSSQEDINEFINFARNLNSLPLIIPDDISKLSEYDFPEHVVIYKEARISMDHRIFIYANSLMNIFPPSGPFYVSLFLKDTKSLMYNIGVNWDDDEPMDMILEISHI